MVDGVVAEPLVKGNTGKGIVAYSHKYASYGDEAYEDVISPDLNSENNPDLNIVTYTLCANINETDNYNGATV